MGSRAAPLRAEEIKPRQAGKLPCGPELPKFSPGPRRGLAWVPALPVYSSLVQMPGEVWGPGRAPKETSAHSRHMWSAAGVSARPQPSTPPQCWPLCWIQGLRGMGSRRAACTCYVTCSSQASSCLLPLTGQDSTAVAEKGTLIPIQGPRLPPT